MVSQKTVLIAEDDRELRELLKQRCRSLGLRVLGVDNAFDALNVARENRPDLICMDVEMPSGNGLAASEMLASDEQLSSIPLVIITGKKDVTTERRCLAIAARYVHKSTNTWENLEPVLQELLELKPQAEENGRSEPEDLLDAVFGLMGIGEEFLQDGESNSKPWVLCIDDDIDFSTGLAKRLEARDISVVNAFSGIEGCDTAMNHPPDAIVLDYNMPNLNGEQVLRRLKGTPSTRDIPVVVLTGRKERAVKMQMMNLGATAFFTKPVEFSPFVDQLLTYINATRGSWKDSDDTQPLEFETSPTERVTLASGGIR